MVIDTRYTDFRDFRTARYSRSHWLNIDVQLQDIVFRRRREGDPALTLRLSLGLDDCVLQGVGAVANVLVVGREGLDFDRFPVAISGPAQDDRWRPAHGLKQPAKMTWRRTGEASPRLEIAIPDNLSRRLVELYVSKRIDAVHLAMRLAVSGAKAEAEPDFSGRFAFLVERERRSSGRAQCEVLSVYTSLGETRATGAAFA